MLNFTPNKSRKRSTLILVSTSNYHICSKGIFVNSHFRLCIRKNYFPRARQSIHGSLSIDVQCLHPLSIHTHTKKTIPLNFFLVQIIISWLPCIKHKGLPVIDIFYQHELRVESQTQRNRTLQRK
jgi:hypothetical protein